MENFCLRVDIKNEPPPHLTGRRFGSKNEEFNPLINILSCIEQKVKRLLK
nr:MAG TPA_asm: hypothetical protein [Caudoviricetes sp.]